MHLQNQHLAIILHTEQAPLITEVRAAEVHLEVTALHLLQQNRAIVLVPHQEVAAAAATVVPEVATVEVVAHLTLEVLVAQEVQVVQVARVAEAVVVVQDHLREEGS